MILPIKDPPCLLLPLVTSGNCRVCAWLLLERVLFDGILEILQQNNVPNQVTALVLHQDGFSFLSVSGPVIKSCLQNSGTGNADRLGLGFCQQPQETFVNSLSHFRGELVCSLKDGCENSSAAEGLTGDVAQSTFSGLLEMGKGWVRGWEGGHSWGLWPWMFSPGPALPAWGGHTAWSLAQGQWPRLGLGASLTLWLCWGLELTPLNPRSTGGTAPHGPPGKAGLSPALHLANQGSVQPRMETAGPFLTNSVIEDVQLAPPAHSWLCLQSPAVTCVIQQSDLLLLHCPAPSLARKQRKLGTISVPFLGTVERSTIFTSIS